MNKIKIMFITCGFIITSNSFGMLTKTSLMRKVTSQKKMRNFHTSKPAHMDPLGTSAWVLSIMNLFESSRLENKINALQNEIYELKEIMKQNEKNNLMISKQNKNVTEKIKTNE